MKRKIWAGICLSAAFLSPALPAIAADDNQQNAAVANPRAMLVLDGSGSMWGKIADGHKILVARKAIASALRPLEDRIDLGLIAYGHRRRGACLDIQMMDRPAPLNAVQFSRLVNQIKPLGKTPITAALEEAAKTLNNGSDKTNPGGSIILLADGPENCRRDPCALITKSFSKDQNLKVHVIAFSMEPGDARSLRCLAANSGGKFLEVSDQAGLELALKSALNAGFGKKPETASPPAIVKRRTKPELRLSAHLGPYDSALRGGLDWTIIKLAQNNQPESSLPPWQSNQANPTFDLEPGRYSVSARYRDYEVNRTLELEKGDAKSEKLVFNLSELNLPASWAKPDSRSGFGKLLFEPQDKSNTSVKNTVISLTPTSQNQLIPAGAYRIVGIENGKIQSWFIHARPGQAIDLPIWKQTGRVIFTMKDKSTGKPLNKPTLSVYPVSEGNIPAKEIARSTALTPQFDLEAGTYFAEIEDGLASTRHEFKVTTGEVTSAEISLDRALLSINLKNEMRQENPALDILQVIRKNKFQHQGELTQLDDKITLPPGEYRLILRSSPTARAIIKDISLKAGDEKSVSFEAQDVAVSFSVNERDDALSRHQIFWRLYDEKDAVIWQSPDAAPGLRLSAGNYRVVAEIGDDIYEETFRLRGNENREIDLSKAKRKSP